MQVELSTDDEIVTLILVQEYKMTELNYIKLVEGDTKPTIQGVYKDENGNPAEIPEGTVINLNIDYETGVLSKEYVPGSGTGEFSFPWYPGEIRLNTSGENCTVNAEVEFVFPDGTQTARETSDAQQFKLKIYKQIG